MTDIYTIVHTPHVEFCIRGRVTREEALTQVRRSFEADMQRLKEYFETPPEQVEVTVSQGMYRQRVLERL